MPIDVYVMRLSGPCRAVLMTARHLNIDVNEKTIDLAEGQQFTPEYLKLNPSHTVPTIDDNGFALWESRAILQYLCNKYAPNSSLYPTDPKKRALVDRTLNLDMSIYPAQRAALFDKMLTGVEPTEDKINALKEKLKLLDQLIGENKYLTGNELTIADLSVLASVGNLELFGYDLTDYPKLKGWISALQSELSYYEEINRIDVGEMQAVFEKMKKKLAEQK